MGRKKLDIDEDQVEKLAMIGCTSREIGAVMGVGQTTIERRFGAILDKGRELGKTSLRRAMWRSATGENASVAMQIFLSKQTTWLGYADKVESKSEHDVKGLPGLTLDELAAVRKLKKGDPD